MRLDEKQVNAVQNYLQGIPDTECALCHQQEWKVSETVFALPEYVQPAFTQFFGKPSVPQSSLTGFYGMNQAQKEPEVFPVIPVVCGKCGFVLFISAVAAGVVKVKP